MDLVCSKIVKLITLAARFEVKESWMNREKEGSQRHALIWILSKDFFKDKFLPGRSIFDGPSHLVLKAFHCLLHRKLSTDLHHIKIIATLKSHIHLEEVSLWCGEWCQNEMPSCARDFNHFLSVLTPLLPVCDPVVTQNAVCHMRRWPAEVSSQGMLGGAGVLVLCHVHSGCQWLLGFWTKTQMMEDNMQ